MGTTRISQTNPSPATTFWLEADHIQTDVPNRRWLVRLYVGAHNGPGGSTSSRYDQNGQQVGFIQGQLFHNRVQRPFLPGGYQNGARRWYDGAYDVWIYANGEGYVSGDSQSCGVSMGLYYGNINQNLHGALGLPRIVTTPPAPSLVGFDEITTNSARLRFSSSGTGGSPIIRWEYRWSTQSNFATSSEWIPSSGMSILTGLPPYTQIHVQFRGVNAYGAGPAGGGAFTTLSTIPEKPPALVFDSATTSSLTYLVDNPLFLGQPPYTRTVELFTETGTTPMLTQVEPGRPSTFSGLSRGTNYRLRQKIKNAIGDSPWSDWITMRTAVVPPSALTGYAPTDAASTSVWSTVGSLADNGGEVPSDIRVQINTVQSDVGALTTTVGFFGIFPITGLTPGSSRWYRLAAYNAAGWGPYGPWVQFTTKTNVPTHPMLPNVSSITSSSASVDWDEPADNLGSTLISYVLRVATNKGISQNVKTFTLPPAETSQALSPLAPATTYYYILHSISSNGLGSTIAIGSFTTTGGSDAPKRWWKRIDDVWRNGFWWKKIDGVWRRGIWWKRIDDVWRRS